jgi:hypothetical protein
MDTTREIRRHRVGIPATALAAALTFALASSSAVSAALFTVGPGGTHATIQAALDEARTTPGAHEIRVAAGHFHERLMVLDAPVGNLRMTGGWNAAFTERSSAPEATVVDALEQGRPLTLWCTSGSLEIEGMAFTGGRSVHPSGEWVGGSGGGVRVFAQSSCRVALTRVAVYDNTAEKVSDQGDLPGHPHFAYAGGVFASAWDGASFELRESRVEGNRAINHVTGAATGGGLYLQSVGQGRVGVVGNSITGNLAQGVQQASIGGVSALALGTSSLVLEDNRVAENRARALGGDAGVPGAIIQAIEGARLEARRNRFLDNRQDGSTFQLVVDTQDAAVLHLSDSIVAGGDGGGLSIQASEESRVFASNLTVADHAENTLSLRARDGASAVSLYNTLVFGNEADVVSVDGAGDVDLDAPSNLVGVDPRFVDPTARDYRLRADSPAIDAGNDHPPGGLGPLDVDRNPRIQGGRVDIGAHESAGDRFCRVDRFGEVTGVPAFTPACSCFRDDALRSMRCGFYFPDLFLVARFPLPLIPGQDIKVDWSLNPWAPFAGQPYRMEAVLDWMGKEIPVEGRGKLEGRLREDKIGSETLLFTTPFEPAVLRTTLQHLPVGGQLPVTSLTEILIALDEPVD